MLKITEVELKLLTDVDQYIFFELACRGGISSINHRYAKSNHPLFEDYNPTQPISTIHYLDKNSLYPEAMRDYMPMDNLR